MNKWQHARAVCRETWSDSSQRPEFLVSILFILLVCGFYALNGIMDYASETGRMNLAELILYPIYIPSIYLLIICGMFLFLMRAPFMARTDTVFLPRVGRWPWIWGKLLFVAEYVGLMLAAYYIVIILFCFPSIDFGRWTWSPYVKDIPYRLGQHFFKSIHPVGALFASLGLSYLFLLLVTLLIVLLNLCFGKIVGLLAASVICFISSTIDWVMPQMARWGLAIHAIFQYHQFDGVDNIPAGPGTRLPTLGESYIVFIVLCALLMGLILWRVKRYDFQTYEKGMH